MLRAAAIARCYTAVRHTEDPSARTVSAMQHSPKEKATIAPPMYNEYALQHNIKHQQTAAWHGKW